MLRVVTPATDEIVSLDDAKAHLRLDSSDDDAYVGALIEAAVSNIDGPSGWLGRCLGEQSLDLTVDSFPCGRQRLNLPLPPLISVDAVSYIDTNGVEQSLADYRVTGVGAPFGGYLLPPASTDWPTTSCEPGSVRVEFTAGYSGGVPAPIRHAILLMIGHWYRNREAVTDTPMASMPLAVEALLSPFRVWTS